MSDQAKLTVTLHWRDHNGERAEQMTCPDHTPQQLIPKLLRRLSLSEHDQMGEPLRYELRLGGEQRPPLRLREPLSGQNVRYGNDIWLVPQLARAEVQLSRCILRQPDGSEIVIPGRGQALTRSWLSAFVELLNPEAFAREQVRYEHRQSPYCYVSERSHCTVSVPHDAAYWVVTTDRTDVITEYATEQVFDRVPVGAPIRLDNGMWLRLGGEKGLVLGITLM
jgi:hypothetical protein